MFICILRYNKQYTDILLFIEKYCVLTIKIILIISIYIVLLEYFVDYDLIFKRLLDFYKVSNSVELAQKMQISQQAISGWKSRKSLSAIEKKCRELGIYNEIFEDIGNTKQQIYQANNKIDNYISDLRLILGETELEIELKKLFISKLLERFRDKETMINKILNLSWEYDRPYLFIYYIFQMIEFEIEKDPSEKITNYKDYLKKIIAKYEVFSLKNKAAFGIRRKKDTINDVELLLSEEDCRTMIQNYKIVLGIIESSMSLDMVRIHKNRFSGKAIF